MPWVFEYLINATDIIENRQEFAMAKYLDWLRKYK